MRSMHAWPGLISVEINYIATVGLINREGLEIDRTFTQDQRDKNRKNTWN